MLLYTGDGASKQYKGCKDICISHAAIAKYMHILSHKCEQALNIVHSPCLYR